MSRSGYSQSLRLAVRRSNPAFAALLREEQQGARGREHRQRQSCSCAGPARAGLPLTRVGPRPADGSAARALEQVIPKDGDLLVSVFVSGLDVGVFRPFVPADQTDA